MSRPQYNFADERPSSPFDRRPQPGSSGPPPNFKTNVNRNKTRKWAEAKQYNYDGDEWGGFDPYDEYGNYDDPAGPPQNPRARQHSFDRGEERRAFSAGTGLPGQQRGPPQPQQRRDFSQPAYAPAPLKSTQSPVGRGPTAPMPMREEEEEDTNDSKPAAAIPFIRPSDIYKRMEQERERERQSMDSSRPSIDSSASKKATTDEVPPVPAIQHAGVSSDPIIQQAQTGQTSDASAPASISVAPTLPDDMPRSSIDGFQSIVDRAFDRPDDNSVPPTPISSGNYQKTQEDLSRSNSESTTGISPIMSRVPSSNTDESRGRAAAIHRERAMSNITEELPLEPPPKSANRQGTHSRTGSGESFIPSHARKVSTPSPHASPARSPRVEDATKRRLSQPLAAEVTEDDIPEPASATSNYSQSTYPTSAVSEKANPPFRAPSMSSDTRSPTSETPVAVKVGSRSSTPLASPVEGRRSPYPGASRVRDLAGKYNEIHEESRRNSQASIKSKTSYSSLRQRNRTSSGQASPEPPVAASPVGTPGEKLERPTYNPQPSFRPHLPGEWVSTTDLHTSEPVAAQPSNLASTAEEKDLPKTPTAPSAPSEIDLTPRAANVDRSASTKTSSSGPVGALKAAGAALGASLTTTVGTSHQARDFASPTKEDDAPADDKPKRSIGDVYMRPLEFQRTASSVASSGAPTPPAKDTPKVEESVTSDTYFHHNTKRDSRDSWEGSDNDEDTNNANESDRLRREIVRSLTPQAQERATDERSRDQDAIDAPDNLREVQKSERAQPAQTSPLRTAQSISDLPEVVELDGSGPPIESGPGLLNKRFSWESKPASTINPSGLASEVDLPQTSLHVTNQETPRAEQTERELPEDVSRERQSSASSATPLPEGRSPVSPVANADDARPSTSDNPPSPLLDSKTDRLSLDKSTAGPEPIASVSLPDTSEKPAKIPSFREIANIKSAPERIDKYNVTRKQFADMNTGLQGWLSTTIAANPELNYLTDANANILPGGPPVGVPRHRQTPSIIKMAKGFGSKGDGPASPSAADGSPAAQPSRRTSNNFSGHSPQSSVNAEKMQAMGKDLLSSAGKLGGKGMAGAKGWLAKGKQRLRDTSGGGDKVD